MKKDYTSSLQISDSARKDMASQSLARLHNTSSANKHNHNLHSKIIQLKCLTTLLLIFVVQVVVAHDQLHTSPHNQPPAIYTISSSDIFGDSRMALTSHRSQKPYSWNNQQLAKQQLQHAADDFNTLSDSQALNVAMGDINKEQENQLGDLSLLYSNAKLSSKTSAGQAHNWPAVVNTRRTVGAQGTKTTASRSTSSTGIKTATAKRHHSYANTKGSAKIPLNRRVQSVDSIPTLASAFNGTLNLETNETRRLAAPSGGKRKNLVCYYGTWAVYRPDAGKYPVELIDPFLCTHIIYGFTGLSYDNTIKPLDPWNDLEDNYGKGAMKRFTNLKRINPDLKTLVAIGGWNEGSIKYSKMASDPNARARFVDSVVKFLATYNFDGLDLDWEYPGSRGGASYDKQNFVRLLRELHDAFKPHGYLLTAAVSAGLSFSEPAYDIPQVSKYLDLINLMAYDYHGGWETKTGMNAPLFHSPKHDLSREDRTLNVNWSVNYWLSQGAAREKIMLGVGSYGRSFTLDRRQENGINAPASQKGRAGPYTREPGSLGYNEICEAFKRAPQSWTIVRDPDYLAPYAYDNERQWVGYDDAESLALKAHYAKSMGLGGMMMWSIETDDFRGECHNEKYPLLNTIRRVLDGNAPQASTSKPPVSSTSRRPMIASTSSRRPQASSTSRRPLPISSTTPGHEIEDVPVSSTTSRRPIVVPPVVSSTSRRPMSTTTARPPSSTTTLKPLPAVSNTEFVCRSEGMFADPRNCRKFIRCVGSGARWQTYKFDCGPGTAFDEQHGYCDHIYNVPACRLASDFKTATDESTLMSSAQLTGNELGTGLAAASESMRTQLAHHYFPSYFPGQQMFAQYYHL